VTNEEQMKLKIKNWVTEERGYTLFIFPWLSNPLKLPLTWHHPIPHDRSSSSIRLSPGFQFSPPVKSFIDKSLKTTFSLLSWFNFPSWISFPDGNFPSYFCSSKNYLRLMAKISILYFPTFSHLVPSSSHSRNYIRQNIDPVSGSSRRLPRMAHTPRSTLSVDEAVGVHLPV
jgi:hypothetical protein